MYRNLIYSISTINVFWQNAYVNCTKCEPENKDYVNEKFEQNL